MTSIHAVNDLIMQHALRWVVIAMMAVGPLIVVVNWLPIVKMGWGLSGGATAEQLAEKYVDAKSLIKSGWRITAIGLIAGALYFFVLASMLSTWVGAL